MRRLFSFLFVIVLGVLVSTQANAKMPIIVTSTPDGADVVIYANDYGRLGECVTPCRKKISEKKLSAVEVFKEGYVPKMVPRSKAIAKDGKLHFDVTMQTLEAYEIDQAAIEKAQREKQAAEKAELRASAAKARLVSICNVEQCPDQKFRPDFRLPPVLPSRATKSGHCEMVIAAMIFSSRLRSKPYQTGPIFLKFGRGGPFRLPMFPSYCALASLVRTGENCRI